MKAFTPPTYGWMSALLAAALMTLGGLGTAAAQQSAGNRFLEDRFWIAVGGFFPTIDSEVRIEGEETADVDVEDQLGLDDRTETLWAAARWRFFRRHAVEFEWIRLDRDGREGAEERFTLGDTTVDVGAQLDTTFDVDLFRLTYGWSFLKDQKKAVTFLVGAHITRARVKAELSGNITDADTGVPIVAGTTVEESEDVTAPLPHVGARIEYAFTPRLAVDASAIGFALKVGDLKGSLIEVQGNVQYLLWRNIALGTGVRYFDFNLEDDKDEGKDEVSFDYFGPVVFVSASF